MTILPPATPGRPPARGSGQGPRGARRRGPRGGLFVSAIFGLLIFLVGGIAFVGEANNHAICQSITVQAFSAHDCLTVNRIYNGSIVAMALGAVMLISTTIEELGAGIVGDGRGDREAVQEMPARRGQRSSLFGVAVVIAALAFVLVFVG